MTKNEPKRETLTPADKRTLSEIQQLDAMNTHKLNELGDVLRQRWFSRNRDKEAAANEYLATTPLPNDMIEREASWNEQYDFVEERFYSVTAVGTGDIYFMRNHERGRADDRASLKSIADTLRNRFGLHLHTGILVEMEGIIPPCVAREYMPNKAPVEQLDFAKYANTWVPPKVKPSDKTVSERPALWQEYLDRLMPREHECWFTNADGERTTLKQQDYLEQWLAQRVRFPQTPNNVAVVLRGDFGTGKGYWLDELASVLIGDINYKSVSTKDWKGDFNADMFESVIIHLEETKDTRQNTGEMLKKLITQNRHRANEKNIPQKQVYKHFAIAISSNHKVPISIDKGDRRYFVPAFSKHLQDNGDGVTGQNETQAFFHRFDHWLKRDGGYQEMRDWLENVELKHGFMMPPHTPDKEEIWLEMTHQESASNNLTTWLMTQVDTEFLFSLDTLAEHRRISTADATMALKDAGYVSKLVNLGKQEGEDKPRSLRFWIPKKHQNTKNLIRKGWRVWNPYHEYTDLRDLTKVDADGDDDGHG